MQSGVFLWLFLLVLPAFGAGARWVTGPPFFTGQAGVPVVWRGPAVSYYTDPGNLSQYVSHAQADALVAAAASVWNVPVASVTVSQAGTLAEHVSGSNVYLGSGGMVYPSDVSVANAAARPVAVVYDTDGSVTDTLLGLGASSPSSCRQNAVFETVDGFDPAGYITHAIIVLNGRCTASAPAAQLDLQYKLQRVWGRVLGLAWSQANDNVFTGTPQPTYNQALNWPLMHPLEIICGTYTYPCLPSPFQLRPDDVASLVQLYPVTVSGGGKQASLAAAATAAGSISFPTGEGMAGVNVLFTRDAANGTTETWAEASAVTGGMFRRNGTSALVPADGSTAGSMGTTALSAAGSFSVGYLPFPSGASATNLHLTTEAVNPLYMGQYSVGPYAAGTVAPSGSAVVQTYPAVAAYPASGQYTVADAAASCGPGLDGDASQAPPVASSGWWQGLVCGYGFASYWHLPVRAGRTFTVEVTALDAGGLATTSKLMPVIGLWSGTDAAGTLPTEGAQTTAFQGLGIGMTTLAGATGSLTEMRLGIADQRGDGRPDFAYAARFFYADQVTPVQIPATGGTVTITGFGFRPGNAVSVNGVAGTVTAWTATEITVTLPTLVQAGVLPGTPQDVTVTDLGTGATSVMSGAVQYGPGTSSRVMKLRSAQVADVQVGVAAPTPFSVQVFQADGVTPVSGEPVVLSLSAGTAGFGACGGAASCTVQTDANGIVQTTVTPGAAGEVTTVATDGSLSETASFNADPRTGTMQLIEAPGGQQTVGQIAQPEMLIRLFATDGSPVSGRAITWTVTAGSALLAGCNAPLCATVTAPNGLTSMTITPLLPGTITLQATDGVLTQTATFQAVLVLDTLQVVAVPGNPVYTGVQATPFSVRLLQPNGYGDYYQPVVFSGSAGVVLAPCGANPCTIVTDSQGYASVWPTVSTAGTYTLTATFGTGVSAITQSTSFTAAVHTVTRLSITGVPANGSPVGQYATQAFSVLLLNADGTPAVGAGVNMGGPTSQVFTNCGRSTCVGTTDSNGRTSVLVMPLRPGPITLSAAAIPFSASATFNAVAAGKSLTVVSQPANGAYVGDPAALTVQVIGPDGVTPVAGDTVLFSVAAGGFSFTGCGQPCQAVTDAQGRATVNGTATAAGQISVLAADGSAQATASWTAQGRLDTLQVVSAPSGKVTAGATLPVPFGVRVLLPDGVTPAVGRTVLFAVSAGYAGFGACTAAGCTVTTDANGMAQTTVFTAGPGAVTLEAIDTSPGQSAYGMASFQAVGVGDTLRVVSQPADGTTVYNFAPLPFSVQLVGPDGTTPVGGQVVTFATTAGNTGTSLCNGAPGCAARTDANGMVSTGVRPLSSGAVTMTATDGALSVSVTFQVYPLPDTLTVVSGPADGSFVGGPAAVPFAVRVSGYGGASGAGRSVTVSVESGAATLGACGGAGSCVLTADGSGMISTTVTPTGAGPVALLAVDRQVQATWSFGAVVRPDALAVVSTPADGGLPGVASSPAFAVRVTGGYAGAAVAGRSVVFTVVGGTAVLGCGAAACTVLTDANGLAAMGVTPGAAGSVVLGASEGGAGVQVQFQVAAPHGLRLVSVPANGSFVGVVASPGFAVQVLAGDGVTPVAGDAVTISATGGTVCGAASCTGVSDAGGMVQMSVTPAAPGTVSLRAVDGVAAVSASFQAVARPDSLSLVSAPVGTGTVGIAMPAAFSVRLLAGDGSARAGVPVVFSAAAGQAVFGACGGAAVCTVSTDASGLASTAVTPGAAGAITVQAVSEGMTVSAAFTASPPVSNPPPPPGAQDTLTLVSAPGGGGVGTVGTAMPVAFSVRLLAGDGKARAGVAVVFSVGAGTAGFGACGGAAMCSVVTDSSGLAATSVIPGAAGAITVQAASEGMVISAGFTAVAPPDGIQVVAGAGATVYVGNSVGLQMRVLKADGTTPDAGVPVMISFNGGGAVGFDACGGAATCQVTSDAAGNVATGLTGVSPGAVTVQAALPASAGGATASAGVTVLANVYGLTGLPAALYVAEGVAFRDVQTVSLVRDGTPWAGQAMVWSGAGGVSVLNSSSTTDVTGESTATASLGPLAAGTQGTLEACAVSGTALCTSMQVFGVAAAELAVTLTAGGSQTVPAGQSPAAVVGTVTDGAGHPVAGAAVTVFQTQYALAACPARGRCPAESVLGTQALTVISGEGGTVSVAPLGGSGTETRLEFTVGTAGVATGNVIQP